MDNHQDNLKPLIASLRKLAESRHKETLAAIDRIAAYLNDSRNLDREVSQSLREIIGRTSSRAAIRERVLSSLEKDPLNIKEIAARTGLTEKQVRGVLYSKQVEKRVNRSVMYGESRFSANVGTGNPLASQIIAVPRTRGNDFHSIGEP